MRTREVRTERGTRQIGPVQATEALRQVRGRELALDREVAGYVVVLCAAGVTWESIGHLYGLSRAQAHRRWLADCAA